VPYRDLLSPFRALAAPHFRRSPLERLRHFLASQTIPYPGRFRLAAFTGRIGKLLRPIVPKSLRAMIDLVPAEVPPAESWSQINLAQGERRGRVALLLSCAQQVLEPDINTATIEVLFSAVERAWSAADCETMLRAERVSLSERSRDAQRSSARAASTAD
jgi:glycolate oxidase iron-sulfur subunit